MFCMTLTPQTRLAIPNASQIQPRDQQLGLGNEVRKMSADERQQSRS